MPNTISLIKKFATLENLPISGKGWQTKVLKEAAKSFYCPGRTKDKGQFQMAKKAVKAAQTSLKEGSNPPEWLEKAVSCAERWS